MSSPAPTPDLHTGFSAPGATPTPWEDVLGVLRSAKLFWISTVRTDGRPHVTPLPAVWREDALYFCTGPGEQKALNLRASDHCALTTGDNRWKAGLDVVVEGRAERVTDDALLGMLAAMWTTKYDGDWRYDVHDGAFHHEPGVAHVFEVRPRKRASRGVGSFRGWNAESTPGPLNDALGEARAWVVQGMERRIDAWSSERRRRRGTRVGRSGERTPIWRLSP
jgi:nitroimidazol reductase NimA-like FMN-containing flavoprotein (pyridoxamine 5'-phosphate oxidase superfamily)